MTVVLAIGAAVCVPVIVVLTLELETKTNRWCRRTARRGCARCGGQR